MKPCIWKEPSHQTVSAAPASFGPAEALMLTAGLLFHIPAIEFLKQGTLSVGGLLLTAPGADLASRFLSSIRQREHVERVPRGGTVYVRSH